MAGPMVQIALVSQAEALATAELERFAGALRQQIERDLAPYWGIAARVSVYRTVTDVPVGAWPVIVQPELPQPGTLGYHGDQHGQPFAMVAHPQPQWTVAASHQCLDMLVDPFSNRLIPGRSPKPDQGRAEFLVQVCDPCASEEFAYEIDSVLVSDFVTPPFYDGSGDVLDIRGAISKPLEVLKDGMLSWREPESEHWWQLTNFGGTPEFRDLGVFEGDEPAG